MYVIFPAVGVVEESYLSLVAQEVEQPTDPSAVVSSVTSPPPKPPAIVVEDTTKCNSQLKTPTSNNTTSGPLGIPTPIYHDTSEEQKRAQAYIIAGYVPFGHHLEQLEQVQQTTIQSASENTYKLQDLFLNQPERYSPIDFEEDFEDFSDEFDPYSFDTGPALPDLITDLKAIKREKRDYTGRIDHIIKLNKKEKICTEGRVQSDSLKAIACGEQQSYQQVPTTFSSFKTDPKNAIGKMASSVPLGPNDRGSVGDGSQHGSVSSMPQGHEGGQILKPSQYKISDLVHPTLNSPLKNHQQVTFRLVKQVSDFTHALSKAHEQHAEDLSSLVEQFRTKNVELLRDRPSCSSTLFTTWDNLLAETESDAQVHANISGVMSRAVSRPLLEKTFHMKIQSRKIFAQRENYETILAKTEEMLIKCHDDYCHAYDIHQAAVSSANQQATTIAASSNVPPGQTPNSQATNPAVAAATSAAYASLVEAHNNYVQQLHAANGMVDQYYSTTLPQLLQELDDVYHDVSAVVAETIIQGADVISLKSGETSRRYDSYGKNCRNMNPPNDLSAFVKTLHIPDSMTVSKHIFSAPVNKPGNAPLQLENPTMLQDELMIDRATQSSARHRFDSLRGEAQNLDAQTKQLTDALETLVRIQARSLESQLFNKANELQEDISLKRFDQRIAQIHLAAVKAQKEMFAAKVDGGSGGGGIGAGGVGGGIGGSDKERKLSNSSATSMKSKWVKAFKGIKKTNEDDVVDPRKPAGKNSANGGAEGGGSGGGGSAHIFQEYTYKKITPCDICSQILRGHTRQGLKCKLCRMNVHPDCQDAVPKCLPKSRLLRRQKSSSEIETRNVGQGGQDFEDDSGFCHDESFDEYDMSMQGNFATNATKTSDSRRQYLTVKSLSTESAKSSASSRGSDTSPGHKSFGGCYSSTKTGVDPFASTGEGTGKPKLASVAAALLKAKRAGQLPTAFGKDIVLPGLNDDIDDGIASPDNTAISNHDTQLPRRNENGIQGKLSPKVSVTSQGGQSKPQGQQPLRALQPDS